MDEASSGQSNACGAQESLTRFAGERFSVERRGLRDEVAGLSGWRCARCGEVEFESESAHLYAAAGDALCLARRRE